MKSQSPPEHLAPFEAAMQEFFDAFFTNRDLASIEAMVGPGFIGYGTGRDEACYDISTSLELTRRDMNSATNPLRYQEHRRKVELIDENNAFGMAELDLATEIMDQEIKLNNFRITLVLHREPGGRVKVSGYHFSFPTTVHEEGEAYPLKELEERTQVLNRMVEEKTKTLQEAYGDLEYFINHDGLTGVHSRHFLEKAMHEEWLRYNRFGRVYSIILCDLNHFKAINDNYGHLVGDQVLKLTGSFLGREKRATDTAGRWGGDEFLLLLPETTLGEALGFAERLRDAMDGEHWPTSEPVSMSFGLSNVTPEDDTLEELFRRADVALYYAKHRATSHICAV